jgi:hypothetical protein
MKLLLSFYLILFGNIFYSCHPNHDNIQIIKAQLATEKCISDTLNTYQLYIPEHFKECKTMPLVLVIDPHGSGNYAIQRFFEAAEKYKCVIIASNLIKNNYPEFNNAIQTLLADAYYKFPLNRSVFIAGFSGGARMAIDYAETNSVAGILVCGALGSKSQLKKVQAPIYSLIGMADFNFPEVAEYILRPTETPSNLFIEITDLKHEWPSTTTIDRGLGFLFLTKSNYKNICFPAKEMMKDFKFNISIYIDSLITNNEYIKSKEILRNFQNLPGKRDNKYFTTKFDTNKIYISYNKEIQQLQQSLQFEMKIREAYYNSLLSKDIKWWKNEIDALDNQILKDDEKYALLAYKRIRSFLGILCYSACRNYLQTNDLTAASKILDLYKLLEPKNPDMLFYFALFRFKSGKNEQAINLLQESLSAGFSDIGLLKQSFPKNIIDKVIEK